MKLKIEADARIVFSSIDDVKIDNLADAQGQSPTANCQKLIADY